MKRHHTSHFGHYSCQWKLRARRIFAPHSKSMVESGNEPPKPQTIKTEKPNIFHLNSKFGAKFMNFTPSVSTSHPHPHSSGTDFHSLFVSFLDNSESFAYKYLIRCHEKNVTLRTRSMYTINEYLCDAGKCLKTDFGCFINANQLNGWALL